MKIRLLRTCGCLLAVLGAVPLLQLPGCSSTSLLDATAFEVSNVFTSLAFEYTQVVMENLLDL
jgi:hypothetical protein